MQVMQVLPLVPEVLQLSTYTVGGAETVLD